MPLTAPLEDAAGIREALMAADIPCTEIGDVVEGDPQVLQKTAKGWSHHSWPERGAVAELFDVAPTDRMYGPA